MAWMTSICHAVPQRVEGRRRCLPQWQTSLLRVGRRQPSEALRQVVQDGPPEHPGLLAILRRPLGELPAADVVPASDCIVRHLRQERVPLLQHPDGDADAFEDAAVLGFVELLGPVGMSDLAAEP